MLACPGAVTALGWPPQVGYLSLGGFLSPLTCTKVEAGHEFPFIWPSLGIVSWIDEDGVSLFL